MLCSFLDLLISFLFYMKVNRMEKRDETIHSILFDPSLYRSFLISSCIKEKK